MEDNSSATHEVCRSSIESAKAPVSNQWSRSECKPTREYLFLFIAFAIGEHDVLENWFIYLAI